MYQIRRERYRTGIGPNDNGPEGGYRRYDVYIGPYESKEDCVEAIIRMEGESSRDRIEYDFKGLGRLHGKMNPTGYIIRKISMNALHGKPYGCPR